MGKVKGAKMYDRGLYATAGMDPSTGGRAAGSGAIEGDELYQGTLRTIDRLDLQTAVNRYRWIGTPNNLSSQEVERMLYLKGQLAWFYLEEIERYMLLPFTLEGGIDVYGRFKYVKPIPMSSGEEVDGKALSEILSSKKLEVLYDVVDPLELAKDPDRYLLNSCVIVRDSTYQLNNTIEPRITLNKTLRELMAICPSFMRTALLSASGVDGVRVNTQDESASVKLASKSLIEAAIRGEKWQAIVGTLDFQSLSTHALGKSEEFLLAMQALDNYRLSLYGLDNGGLFQKRSHMLEAEQEMNVASSSLILSDGLQQRQWSSTIINSVWGTGTWCECSEEVLNADLNGDGLVSSREESRGDPTMETETSDQGGEE